MFAKANVHLTAIFMHVILTLSKKTTALRFKPQRFFIKRIYIWLSC